MVQKNYDIIVIGAGIIGTTTTLELQQSGHQVLNISKHLDLVDTASFANAGRIVVDPQAKSFWTIARHILLGNISLRGITFQTLKNKRQWLRRPEKNTKTAFGHLCQKSIEILKLNFRPSIFFTLNDYFVDSHALNLTNKQKSQDCGADYISDTIVSFKKHGNQIIQVVGQNHCYDAPKIVLCAGIRSSSLAQTIGIDLPIIPLYGYSVEGVLKVPCPPRCTKMAWKPIYPLEIESVLYMGQIYPNEILLIG